MFCFVALLGGVPLNCSFGFRSFSLMSELTPPDFLEGPRDPDALSWTVAWLLLTGLLVNFWFLQMAIQCLCCCGGGQKMGGQRRGSSGSGLAFFIRSAGTPREDRNGKPDQEKETLKETFPLAVQKEEEKVSTVRVLDITEEEGNKETEEDFENTGFPPSPPRAKKSDPWNPLASLIRPARQALDWLQSPRKRTLPSPVLEDGARALPTLGTTRRHKKFRVEPTSHRRDLPFLKMWQKSSLKASRKKAVELASGAGGQGRHSIEKKFFANSTIAPRASKRETIRRVLGAADKFNHGLIDEDALKTLASLLQESNYKSGKAYVIEAKVWHVESGGSWSPAMDRTFKLCKKALDRGQGPPNKAPEVPAIKRVPSPGLSFRAINGKVKFSFELFLFCMVWMLREIEAAMFHVKDLYLDEDKKLVTLSWPVSKTDPEARGVKRTLQCLCGGACSSECPYKVSADLVKKVTNFNGQHSLLAVTKLGQGVEKSQVVASWAHLFGMKVGGHSARRTGALEYIRSGWEVPQVAYLGRWKSSVILSYAQEALETVPANAKCQAKGGNLYPQEFLDREEVAQMLQDTKDKVKRDISKLKADMKTADDKVKELSDTFEKCNAESNGALPAFVMSLHSQVVHDNVDTLLTSPPFTWRTKCGWYYSSSHYSFKAEGPITCAKCKGARLQ